MLAPGDRIGPLTIERPLGRGGMGEVYLAVDERLERLVAIKLLPATSGMDPDAHARMLREARSLSALKHASIVTIHDIGVHDGLSYIVMEYVEGETFEELVKRRGRLPPEEAVAILAQVCDAVAAAHDAGVLHRDIKSANLMIDASGKVMVLDFGLSKRTEASSTSMTSLRRSAPSIRDPGSQPASTAAAANTAVDVGNAPTAAPSGDLSYGATTPAPAAVTPNPTATGATFSEEPQTVHGATMGTPGWAPPELIEGRPADARTDVFSLGCVLYHLITGTPPFAGASWSTQRELIETGPTPPSRTPDVPPAFDAVIAAALDPDPERRPAGVRELVAAARAATARRQPRIALAIGAVMLLGAGVAIAAAVRPDDAAPGFDAAPLPPPTPTQLTTLGGCAYSPTFVDDDTVVFDLTKGGAVDLYALDLGPDGTARAAPRQLTSDAGWEWRASPGVAPDEVVFPVNRKDARTIGALDIVTGARRTLVGVTGPVTGAGDAYYYAPEGARAIRRIRAGVDELLLPLPPARQADTLIGSRDGRRLGVTLFDRSNLPEVCVVELAVPSLTCLDVKANSARPAFSSSGEALYVEGVGDAGMLRVPVAGGPAVEVLPDTDASGGYAVSPSGATAVFSDCSSRSELVAVLDDPGRPITPDRDAAGPELAADGTLVFLRGGWTESSLMIRATDGTLRDQFTRQGSVLSEVSIAPDSDAIAFVVADKTAPGIYITRRSSLAAPNRLTEDPNDSRPVFSGRDLLFTRYSADGIPAVMRVSLGGSPAEPVMTRPRVTRAHGGGRVLLTSPDNRVYYWWDPATDRETPGPVLPGDRLAHRIGLSADGRWLAFVSGASGQEIWRMRTDGSSPAELVHELSEERNAGGIAVDNRGKLVITVSSWRGELWLARAHPGHPW